MKKTLKLSPLFILICVSLLGKAQESEGDLFFNPVQAEQFEKERNYPERLSTRGTSTLTLPFFDDFSRFSLPTSNPDIPEEWQRWEDNMAYINSTFAVEPPTIGVATLDGMMANGYPYDFVTPGVEGPADTLTSMTIDLSSFDEDDDVFLTFMYQAQGFGNAPEEEDSLILDFATGSSGTPWITVWSVAGEEVQDFEQVFIPIHDLNLGDLYFHDEFQFRFRNLATLNGNMDHWNIDYVVMDEGIDPDDFEMQELAVMYPVNTLLNQYTSMPWSHFKEENIASSNMHSSLTLFERNLDSQDFNFTSGFKVEYEDQSWDMLNSWSNTSNNADQITETAMNINSSPNSFVFDTDVNDTCAVFQVKFYHDSQDATPQNDTTTSEQVFTNFYSYDDGTAERSYSLNTPGGKVAVKYQAEIGDSLLGLFIHFTPFWENVEDEDFLLRIWGDNNGSPGSELALNYGFQNPHYWEDGHNTFGYYEYDNPVWVDNGSFYVGWTQTGAAELNVGNDKNTNTNPSNLFYQLGLGAEWQQSSITGSVMIRPVFQAGKSEVWNSIAELNNSDFLIYPNPTSDKLNIHLNTTDESLVSIYDLSGRVVYQQDHDGQELSVDVNMLAVGSYLVEVKFKDGSVLSRKKFLKK